MKFSPDDNPTRQEAFSASVRHILSTGKPSVDERGTCVYSGSGCGLAPFAPKDQDERAAWDAAGSISDLPADWLPDYIRNDIEFYEELQAAHDTGLGPNFLIPANWLDLWKTRMRKIAVDYALSAVLLEDDA